MTDNAEIAVSQESTYVTIGFFWKVINGLKRAIGGGGWLYGTGVPSASIGFDGNFYLNTVNGDVYLKIGGVWVFEGSLGSGASVLNNFTSVVAPTVNDDSSAGYSAGSGWFNSVTGRIYFAQSVAVGAAVWAIAATGSLTPIRITAADFIGQVYTNATLIGKTAEVNFDLFTAEGSGVLLNLTDDYTFNSLTGAITTSPQKYMIQLYS